MNTICRLHQLGIFKASGPDAASFLHGQLSNDMIHMPRQTARLAAYCSPQGKMLASFIVFNAFDNTYYLIGSADLLAATLKRLNMFILRSQVILTDMSTALPVHGLTYDNSLPVPPLEEWELTQKENDFHIELPSVGKTKRRMILASEAKNLPQLPEQPEKNWQWLSVQSGMAFVQEATRDRYIPQMFNYESIGGIDFQKGCYPGQEVISRSQFRGTLKRKLFLLHSQEALQINDFISTENHPDDPCGEIVLSSTNPQGGHDALAVMRSDCANAPLIDAQGNALKVNPLPYTIKEDF